MTRGRFHLLGGVVLLASAIAAAQPAATPPIGGTAATAPTLAPTRAPILLPSTPVPVVPAATPAPVVATTSGAAVATTSGALAAGTPIAPGLPSGEIPVSTPIEGRNAVSLEPGADKNLVLPVYAGDPSTAIGNEQIYLSLSPLRRAWFLREFYRNRSDAPKMELATEVMQEVRLDAGLQNATSISAALATEARQLQKEKKHAEAVAAAQAATKIAPDYTSAWTTLARVHLRAFEIGPAFGGIEGALRSTANNLRSQVRIFGNMGLAAIGGIYVAFALFLIVAFVRHGRYLAHDFRHALADNMPAWLAAIIFVPFLVFPLVFGVGPFALLAWWSVVLFIKLTMRERIVVAVFLLLGAALPVFLEKAAVPFAFEGGDAARLHAAIHEDELSARDFQELEALAGETKDPDIYVTLGIAHQRTGRYPKAREMFWKAKDAGAGGNALVGIGIVHYSLGETQEAIAAFEKALAAADSSALAAYFNLSQIHAERTDLARSTEALQQAKAIDAEACERHLRNMLPPARKNVTAAPGTPPVVAAAYANRFLMVDEVSDSALLARAARHAPALAARTWAEVSPAVPLKALPFVFGFALAVCGALAGAFRGAVPSRPCPRCGKMLCLRCDGPPLEEDLCTQCFHAFIQNEKVDPRARAAKEMEVRRNYDRRLRRRKIFSLFVPGAGQVFAGETVRGAVLLVIVCLAGVRAAFWHGWFRPAHPLPGAATQIATSAAALLVLIVAWWIAQRAPAEERRR